MKSRYLGQSGFLIELSTATLVFDWAQGQLPRLREGIPVYFFISHVHSDHFSPEVFKRAEKLPKVEIYLGYDNSIPNINNFLKGLPGNVASHLHCVDGFKKFKSEDGNLIITTLKSTDMGVAFLVEVEEQTIYHAGDLYLMQAMNKEDYRRWYGEMLVNEPGTPVMDYESQFIHHNNEFFSYTEPLRGKIIDYGMIPLDPRVEGVAHKTLMRYMNIATFKAWSPMHLWGRYEFVENFCKEYPDVVGEMEPFKQPGEYEDEPEVEELETQEAEGKEPSPESEEAMAPQDASVPVPEVDESEAADTSQSVEYLGAIRHLETFDAWGPQDRETFTWARRAKFITLNSITDNPRIGDERNFVRVRDLNQKGAKFSDKVELEPGGLYEVAIWFHNDADPNSVDSNQYVAKDVRLRINHAAKVPRGFTSEILGMVSASNSTPGRVWDKAFMHSRFDAVIKLDERSAVIHSNGVCNGMHLSMDELLRAGALLGYSQLRMGELPAGGSFAGYVTYRFTVEKA